MWRDAERRGAAAAATLAVMIAVSLAACSLPRDPNGTLERVVRGRTLRVGVTERPPLVIRTDAPDAPDGVEVALVRAFADRLGADVSWMVLAVPPGENRLLAHLDRFLATRSTWVPGELERAAARNAVASPPQ